MKTKSPAPRKTPRAKRSAEEAPTRLQVAVDYPLEEEQVRRDHYAVRISAPDATEAEISINERPWQPCRESAGFRWFDWYPESTGEHRLAARARVGKGRWAKSEIRTCLVVD